MPENPEISKRDLIPELVFSAVRSSGPGGQHVNKVNTRIELRFDILNSRLLTAEEKKILSDRLAGRMNKEGILILACQSGRSQLFNKRKVIERFLKLIGNALVPARERQATKPTVNSRMKRLEAKHILSEKKARRKNAFEE
jgi:ribosome-associated protein